MAASILPLVQASEKLRLAVSGFATVDAELGALTADVGSLPLALSEVAARVSREAGNAAAMASEVLEAAKAAESAATKAAAPASATETPTAAREEQIEPRAPVGRIPSTSIASGDICKEQGAAFSSGLLVYHDYPPRTQKPLAMAYSLPSTAQQLQQQDEILRLHGIRNRVDDASRRGVEQFRRRREAEKVIKQLKLAAKLGTMTATPEFPCLGSALPTDSDRPTFQSAGFPPPPGAPTANSAPFPLTLRTEDYLTNDPPRTSLPTSWRRPTSPPPAAESGCSPSLAPPSAAGWALFPPGTREEDYQPLPLCSARGQPSSASRHAFRPRHRCLTIAENSDRVFDTASVNSFRPQYLPQGTGR